MTIPFSQEADVSNSPLKQRCQKLRMQFAAQPGLNQRIGIVINHYSASYYGLMLDGASDYLREQGFDAIVQSTSETPDGETNAWQSLVNCGCAGQIIHSTTLSDARLRQQMSRYPQSILMNRLLPDFRSRCVYVDNRLGASFAADYLVKKGHREIAMITGPQTMYEVRERSRGFTSTLAKHGIELPARLIAEADFLLEGGRIALHRLLQSQPRISAVFVQSDQMAAGALDACHELGIKVPGDLSIIGYDDQNIARTVSPKLTTIRQPMRDIGRLAATRVMRLLCKARVCHSVPQDQDSRILPSVVERSSVLDLTAAVRRTSVRKTSLLTPRESQCLALTGSGKSSCEIAVELGIAENTVNFHMKNCMQKLNARNRANAVAKALSRSLIQLDQGC